MNCGYGNGYSVFDVIDTLSEISGKAIPYDMRIVALMIVRR